MNLKTEWRNGTDSTIFRSTRIALTHARSCRAQSVRWSKSRRSAACSGVEPLDESVVDVGEHHTRLVVMILLGEQPCKGVR